MGLRARAEGSRSRWLWAVMLWGVSAAWAAEEKGGGTMTIEKENYLGWPNTYVVRNAEVELRVVTDVGPRIIDFRRRVGPNVLYVRESEAGQSGEPHWVFRGGWRLWVAPEQQGTTYAPDNAPCAVEVEADRLRVTGPPQPQAGIQKIVEVTLSATEPRARLKARIRNIGRTSVRYAAWSLPVLRPGGRAFLPVDRGPLDAFDAVRRYILWSYTRFDDPRYRWGNELIEVDHRKVAQGRVHPGHTRRTDESKIGTDSRQGWAAYLWQKQLFFKRFAAQAPGEYPDGGSTTEVYSSVEFLELENLGPLSVIEPGEEIVLPEDWWLFDAVDIPEAARSEDHERAALRALAPYIEKTRW